MQRDSKPVPVSNVTQEICLKGGTATVMQAMEQPRVEKDKRILIFEAAVAVFSQRGFHEAKMEEIAARAGVGKGTVYEYFSSKLELFQEMIKAGLTLYSESLFSKLEEISDFRERLKCMFMLHLQFTAQYRDLAKIIFADHTSINDEMRQWLMSQREEKVAKLASLIAEQKHEGQIRNIDPRFMAHIIAGIIGALCYPIIFENQQVDVNKLAEQAVDIIFYGIAARSGA